MSDITKRLQDRQNKIMGERLQAKEQAEFHATQAKALTERVLFLSGVFVNLAELIKEQEEIDKALLGISKVDDIVAPVAEEKKNES